MSSMNPVAIEISVTLCLHIYDRLHHKLNWINIGFRRSAVDLIMNRQDIAGISQKKHEGSLSNVTGHVRSKPMILWLDYLSANNKLSYTKLTSYYKMITKVP